VVKADFYLSNHCATFGKGLNCNTVIGLMYIKTEVWMIIIPYTTNKGGHKNNPIK